MEEVLRQEIDREEEALKAEKRRLAIERANKMLYDQVPSHTRARVRAAHSHSHTHTHPASQPASTARPKTRHSHTHKATRHTCVWEECVWGHAVPLGTPPILNRRARPAPA